MKDTVSVATVGGSSYPVVFRSLDELPRSLEEAGLRPGSAVVVVDHNVRALHEAALSGVLSTGGWNLHVHEVPAGETTKSLDELSRLYDAVLSLGIDRSTALFAFGGGVVGDLAGFAAATLLRGIPLVQLPTSLIAQVDSSIGGKTGINHERGKNLIGSFYPPRLVFSDSSLLSTLPEREFASGLAEVVKHAIVRDAPFLPWLTKMWPQIIARDAETTKTMVARAAALKVDVVSRDEFEGGLRAVLNFGHTFGHAIEREAGYGVLTHGEAVAIGMRAALWLSKRYHPDLPFDALDGVVARIPVPRAAGLSIARLVEATGYDKKSVAGRARFVLLSTPGHAYVQANIPPDVVADAFQYALPDPA